MNAHRPRARLRRLHDDRGFSLVELAVYIVLLGIVSAIVASVVVVSFQTERAVSATTDTANSVQTFSASFNRDVRNSRSAVVSGTLDRVTLCAVSTSGAVVWREITWTFSGDKLTRREGGSVDAVLYGGVAGRKEFGVSGRDVTYDFDFGEDGTASHRVEGTIRLGPVLAKLNTDPASPEFGTVVCP